MTNFATPALASQFTDDVLALLAKHGKAHQRTGNREGEMSLSHLVDCLRHGDSVLAGRWRNLRTSGWSGNVQDCLQEAGFTVRTQMNGRALRTYVGV